MKVKVMAVADVHGDFSKLDVSGVDVVIVAGDIGPGGTKHGYDSDAWAEGAALLAWFKKNSRVRFYILPGNHDLFAKHHEGRQKLDKLWPDNVLLLKDKGAVDPSGLTIWGMPWNPIHIKPNGKASSSKGGAFAADDPKIIAKCEKIIRSFGSLDILVTHAPPKIPDTEYAHGGWHLSPALATMLPRIAPRLLICGHKHQLSHKPIQIDNGNGTKTTIVNVSMKLGHHDPEFTYEPRIIEFEIERTLDVKMNMTSPMFAAKKMSASDRDWLKSVSIRIEKTVRGMNKLIDEGKSNETASRNTGVKFNKEVDLERLVHLAQFDKTGRVAKLIDVVKLLKASEAKGWTKRVLPDLWQPNAPSEVYGGKRRGNVAFAAYRYV